MVLIPVLTVCLGLAVEEPPVVRPPNILLILIDDAGFGDFKGGIETPRIDSIAEGGVRCWQGYVTAAVCSPSRAGLLTGRYQQRFGHEYNLPGIGTAENAGKRGLALEEATLAQALKMRGYRTGAIGKWHLGTEPQFHPRRRGFDEWFGFLGGSRSYHPRASKKLSAAHRLWRDDELVGDGGGYLTDRLAEEAAAFIDRAGAAPWFLYLSFNAVHTPMHATPFDLYESRGVPEKRRTLVAMTRALDRAVGVVLDRLDALDLADDTLVWFINDNGGPTPYNHSSNEPLSGVKGTMLEGGVRVPFLVRWPARIRTRRAVTFPVSTLDVFATSWAAAGGTGFPDGAAPLDGVDLVPYLTGEKEGRPHETLFWKRQRCAAVRDGDLKLIRFPDRPPVLYDLPFDLGEEFDLAAERPEDVARLLALIEAWEDELPPPTWVVADHWLTHNLELYERYGHVAPPP